MAILRASFRTRALIAVLSLFSAALVPVVPASASVSVAVWSDPRLDTATGCDNESVNLKAQVQATTGFTLDESIVYLTDSDLASKLDAVGFFFVPDIEAPAVSTVLPDSAKPILRDWVNSGGVFVQTGTYGSKDVDFLNAIFSLGLVSTSGSTWSKDATNTIGTPYEDGPTSLNGPSATDSIDGTNVAGFKAMYGTTSNAAVATISYGAGTVIFLGWDFYAGGPTCSQASNTWATEIFPASLNYAAALSDAGLGNASTSGGDLNYTFSQSGTAYYVVVPAGSAPPTASQVKAGVSYAGGTLSASGNGPVVANVQKIFSLTTLQEATDYVAYIVTEYIDNSTTLISSVQPTTFSTLPGVPMVSSVSGVGDEFVVTYTLSSGRETAIEYSVNAGTTWTAAPNLSSPWSITGLNILTDYDFVFRSKYNSLESVSSAAFPANAPGIDPTISLSYNSANYPDSATVGTLNKGGSSGVATYSIGAYGAGDRATNCSVDATTGIVSADSAGVCRVMVTIAAAGSYNAGSAEAFATIAKSSERIRFYTSNPLTVYSPDLQTTRTVSLSQDPDDSEKFSIEIKLGETLVMPFNSPNAEGSGYTSYYKCPSVVGPGESSMFPYDGNLAKGQAGYGDSTYYIKAKQIGACSLSGGTPSAQILNLSSTNYNDPLSQRIYVNVVRGDQNPIEVTGSNSADFGQTVTLNASGGSGIGDLSYQVSGAGCSIQTVPMVYGSQTYAAFATGELTKSGAGTCDVSVTKAADTKYEAITSADFTVTFGQGGQEINFTSAVPTQPAAGGNYTPAATASSSLAVTFSASGSCSYSAGTVTFTSSGACTITASQLGDGDYSPAPSVTQLISVGERNQTISFNAISDMEFGDPAFRASASSTEDALAVALTSANTSVCTIDSNGIVTLKAAGTCTIIANQAGQAGVVAAASQVTRSFEVYPAGSSAPFITSVSRGLGSLTATLVPPSYTGGATITKYEVTAFDSNGDIAGFNNNCAVATPQRCTVEGLVEGVNYTLRARAFHNAGFGSMSPDSVAAAPVGNPDAVRELSALAGDTTLTISWLSPLSLGGATFSRYDIYVKSASDSTFPASPAHTLNSVVDGSYTFTGMTNGESYDVKMVTITDLEGTEITSNTALVTQVPYTTSNAVRDLTAFELGDDLYITWRYPDFDGGRGILNYDVDVNLGELGCSAVVVQICVISKGDNLAFDVQALANNVAGAGLPASFTYLVPALAGSNAPAPYQGPLVTSVSSRSPIAGQRVAISGQHLDSVTSMSISGKSLNFSLTLAGGLSFEFPEGLTAGKYDLLLRSSFGLLTVQDVFEVRGGTSAAILNPQVHAELKNIGDGLTKVYVFDVVGAGKVQIFANGKEIAWVNATENDDSKLRQLPNGDGYLVRSVSAEDLIQVLISGVDFPYQKG